jgi:hypothetical protein
MGNCCSKKKKQSVIEALTVVDNNTSSASNVQGGKKEEIQAKAKQINNEVTNAERKRSENQKETSKSSTNLKSDDAILKYTLCDFSYKKLEEELLKNEIIKDYKHLTNLHELRNFPYIEKNELNLKTLEELKKMYYQVYFSDIFFRNYNKGLYKENIVKLNAIKDNDNLSDLYEAIKFMIDENNNAFLEKQKQNDKNEKFYDDVFLSKIS